MTGDAIPCRITRGREVLAPAIPNPSYQAALDLLRRDVVKMTISSRSKLLTEAKSKFLAAAQDLDGDDSTICLLNAAYCAANSGDTQSAESILAGMPSTNYNRWYHNGPLLRPRTYGNTTQFDGLGGVIWLTLVPIRIVPGILTGFQWTWPHMNPTTEETAIAGSRGNIEWGALNTARNTLDFPTPKTVVTKPATPEIPLQFIWATETPAARSLRDVDVSIEPLRQGNTHLATMAIHITNKSDRVIKVKDMAARFEYFPDDRSSSSSPKTNWDLKTVDAEYRLMPRSTTTVELNVNDLGDTLGTPKTGRLTVFDIPAEFDAKVGDVTQKQNLAWDFSFVPGRDGQPATTKTVRDPEKSYVTYQVVIPGKDYQNPRKEDLASTHHRHNNPPASVAMPQP
jgi:hypothetical protein